MATIYRYIIETREGNGEGGLKSNKSPSKKTTAKGIWVGAVGPKGGVEHNRKMRAINPLLNKMTSGYWEKGMRVGRAGMGLIQRNTETGRMRFSGPAFAIIIAFIIQSVLKMQKHQRDIANKQNIQNYKSLENGVGAIHGEYAVSRNFWTGKVNYNENK